MALSDSIIFLSILLFLFAFLVCFALFLSQSSCFTLFNMILFGCFSVLFIYFFSKKKKLKNQKNTKTVCVLCTLVLVYLGWSLKQSFLNFVSFVT